MENGLEIDEVVARIHKAIQKIESFKQTEDGAKAVKNFMYSSTKSLFSGVNLSDTERELLETKRELINLILDYHVKKEAGGSVTYSEDLLRLYGFEPCRVCCPIDLGF